MSLSLTGVMLGQVKAVGTGPRDPGAPAGGHCSPALPGSWAACEALGRVVCASPEPSSSRAQLLSGCWSDARMAVSSAQQEILK